MIFVQVSVNNYFFRRGLENIINLIYGCEPHTLSYKSQFLFFRKLLSIGRYEALKYFVSMVANQLSATV